MSAPGNPFEKDWEDFRFPVRPVRIFSDDSDDCVQEEDEDGSGDEGASSGGGPGLDPGWRYMPEKGEIHHLANRKRIRLLDLDTGLKIIRLLAAIEARPELDVDGLIDALEYAAWDIHGQALGDTLEAHSDGSCINWVAITDPAPSRSHSSTHKTP